MKKPTFALAAVSAAAMMSFLPVMGMASQVFPAYAASGWEEENGNLVYYDEDGYQTTDAWRKYGDDWYYLDENGQIAKDLKIDRYYVGPDGKMVKDSWAELENEDDPDSPETPASYWYYFDSDGKSVVSSWKKINGKWYYFNENGHMLTGKVTIDGATYYLGSGSEGHMRTGWIRLEDNASNPSASESWYYFNSDGTMTETQYDKKIDGNYYTFIDGRMQTGWVAMPKAEAEENADAASTVSIADYQYYGSAGDGKRAEGWLTITGIEGIHDMDETYTFYFKNGKAYYSSVKGNSLFSVGGRKFAFNERGEMQTGQIIVNLEDGGIANFYFGADGGMKTGKQNIYNEDTAETESWFFYTDGDRKGQGYHGIKDNVLYVYGKRQEAAADERYAAAVLNDKTYLVNTVGQIQRASASSTSSEKPELGRGYRDFKDASGKIWVVDTTGLVQ